MLISFLDQEYNIRFFFENYDNPEEKGRKALADSHRKKIKTICHIEKVTRLDQPNEAGRTREFTEIASGTSVRKLGDPFSKNVGRIKALQKALKNLKALNTDLTNGGRQFNVHVWDQYFSQHNMHFNVKKHNFQPANQG